MPDDILPGAHMDEDPRNHGVLPGIRLFDWLGA